MSRTLEAKIVILGAQGVGKTSLVHRYIHQRFPSPSPSTIGASFLTKRVIDTDSDTLVRLQIWDTAGQERFRSISRLYYRGANACIICYSVVDEQSFREMGRWLDELRRELGEGVVLHVVGTKADLVAQDPARRQVPFERCIAYVAENLYPAQGSTPPPTAGEGAQRQLRGSSAGADARGAAGTHSKRSSGFWGQDVGWDCCHEISAESGEGVDEVFRVVTRKLVEQARRREESEAARSPGSPYGEGEGEYFDGANGRGSIRVGRDRRSWLGFPTAGQGIDEAIEENAEAGQRGGKCC
jgi:small GTP-binding protein